MAGFAGSVQIGMKLTENLKQFLQPDKGNETYVAAGLYRICSVCRGAGTALIRTVCSGSSTSKSLQPSAPKRLLAEAFDLLRTQ